MNELGYVAALVLAGLFAWAGVAKLGARRRTTRTFRALGLPAPEALAVAVPIVEWSAKVSNGALEVVADDDGNPLTTGLVPLRLVPSAPVPFEGDVVPSYVATWQQ